MSMNLGMTSLFRGIKKEEIEGLLACFGAVRRKYPKGATVLREGEPTKILGVVLSGRVIIGHDDIWGNHTILGEASPGEDFAAPYACISGEPLLSYMTAAEDTEVLFLNIDRVLGTCTNACEFHTKLVRNLLTVTALQSLNLSRRILHTSSKTIRGRLMAYFSFCIKKTGQYSFEIPYNRQQLADYLGVDRSAMCGELSRMRKDGLIRYRKNHFEISEAAEVQD